MTDVDASLPLATRLWFALVCFFRVLGDPRFAARAKDLADGVVPELPPAPPEPVAPAPVVPTQDSNDAALQLLSLLQREGRFVDFVQQDITSFGDADVAAAARVVHEGCRRALGQHATLANVRSESEGSTVTVEAPDPVSLKLTGNVSGSAPYRGVLRHRGWRVEKLSLPTRVGDADLRVVAPAEVEL